MQSYEPEIRTGTIGAPVLAASTMMPVWALPGKPVLERVPSGNMITASPFPIASAALSSIRLPPAPRLMGITPTVGRYQPRKNWWKSSSFATKRNRRGTETPTDGGSR